MNPEALQYSFDLFSKDGYSGSIEDYKSLISTNDEALNYSFNLFEKDGYSGDLNSFKDITIGTDEIKEPEVEEKELVVEEEKNTFTPNPEGEAYYERLKARDGMMNAEVAAYENWKTENKSKVKEVEDVKVDPVTNQPLVDVSEGINTSYGLEISEDNQLFDKEISESFVYTPENKEISELIQKSDSTNKDKNIDPNSIEYYYGDRFTKEMGYGDGDVKNKIVYLDNEQTNFYGGPKEVDIQTFLEPIQKERRNKEAQKLKNSFKGDINSFVEDELEVSEDIDKELKTFYETGSVSKNDLNHINKLEENFKKGSIYNLPGNYLSQEDIESLYKTYEKDGEINKEDYLRKKANAGDRAYDSEGNLIGVDFKEGKPGPEPVVAGQNGLNESDATRVNELTNSFQEKTPTVEELKEIRNNLFFKQITLGREISANKQEVLSTTEGGGVMNKLVRIKDDINEITDGGGILGLFQADVTTEEATSRAAFLGKEGFTGNTLKKIKSTNPLALQYNENLIELLAIDRAIKLNSNLMTATEESNISRVANRLYTGVFNAGVSTSTDEEGKSVRGGNTVTQEALAYSNVLRDAGLVVDEDVLNEDINQTSFGEGALDIATDMAPLLLSIAATKKMTVGFGNKTYGVKPVLSRMDAIARTLGKGKSPALQKTFKLINGAAKEVVTIGAANEFMYNVFNGHKMPIQDAVVFGMGNSIVAGMSKYMLGKTIPYLSKYSKTKFGIGATVPLRLATGGVTATSIGKANEAVQLNANYWLGNSTDLEYEEGLKHLTDIQSWGQEIVAFTALGVRGEIFSDAKRRILDIDSRSKITIDAAKTLGIKEFSTEKEIVDAVAAKTKELGVDKMNFSQLNSPEIKVKTDALNLAAETLRTQNTIVQSKEIIKNNTNDRLKTEERLDIIAQKVSSNQELNVKDIKEISKFSDTPVGNENNGYNVRTPVEALSKVLASKIGIETSGQQFNNFQKALATNAHIGKIANIQFRGESKQTKSLKNDYIGKNLDLQKVLNEYNNLKRTVDANPEIASISKQMLKDTKSRLESIDKEMQDLVEKNREIEGVDFETDVAFVKAEAEKLGIGFEVMNSRSFINAANKGKFSSNDTGVYVPSENKIYINKDAALEKGAVSVASHELAHALTRRAFKNADGIFTSEGIKTIDSFINDVMSNEQRSLVEERISQNYNPESKDFKEKYYEEYLNVFLDGVKRGEFKMNDTFKQSLNSIFKSRNKVDLSTGQGVKNFIDILNRSSKKGSLDSRLKDLYEAGEVAAESKALTGEAPASKDAPRPTPLQEINKLISQEIKNKEDYDQYIRSRAGQSLVSSIYTPGGVINNYIRSRQESRAEGDKIIDNVADRILNFNPESKRADGSIVGIEGFGESIFANTRFGKLDAKRDLAIEAERKKKTVSTDDEQARQIASTETTTKVDGKKAKVTPKSKITRDFPEIFTEDLKNEIDKGLLEIFEGELPGVETKEFKSFITEASRGKLTNKVKKALGGGKNYEFSIKKMAAKMKETLDPRFFVRLESQTKPENRIFTKPARRLTKQADIDAAMLNDKVYVENTAQGVNIYEFKDFTPKQLSDYILAPTISPTTGAKSGLRGTRKTAFAEGLVDRLTRDATPQNLKRIGKEPSEIAEISKKMQVDPSTIMASKDLVRALKDVFDYAEGDIGNLTIESKEDLIKKYSLKGEEEKVIREIDVNQFRQAVENGLEAEVILSQLIKNDFASPRSKRVLENLKIKDIARREGITEQEVIDRYIKNAYQKDAKELAESLGFTYKGARDRGSEKTYKEQKLYVKKFIEKLVPEGMKFNELPKNYQGMIMMTLGLGDGSLSRSKTMKDGSPQVKGQQFRDRPLNLSEYNLKRGDYVGLLTEAFELGDVKGKGKTIDEFVDTFYYPKNWGKPGRDVMKFGESNLGRTQLLKYFGKKTYTKKGQEYDVTLNGNKAALQRLYDVAKEVIVESPKNQQRKALETMMDLMLSQTNRAAGGYKGLVGMDSITPRGEKSKPTSKDVHNEHLSELFSMTKDFSLMMDRYIKGEQSIESVNKQLKRMVEDANQALITEKRRAIKDASGAAARDYMNNLIFLGKDAKLQIPLKEGAFGEVENMVEFVRDNSTKSFLNEIANTPYGKLTETGIIVKQQEMSKADYQKLKNQNIEVAKEASMASKDLSRSEIRNELNKRDKAFRLANERSKTIKKARVFDFDDTIARSKSKVFAERDGKRKMLTAEEFAKQGEKLISEGWTMDFTDFNKVVEGKKGPLFDLIKTMKEAKGERDIFILTARAPESQKAIYEFMKAMGVEIPLENITGLGKSSGQAKADWLVDKASEGYNDFYFADDAPQNVKAVRDALEVLDVKSKTQQAYASKDLSRDFNNLIEESTGIGAEKVFSDVKAQVRGAKAKRQRFFIPPSAEDMLGLVYTTLGKGKKGEAHLKFYQENLFDPYTRAMENLSTDRVNLMEDFKALKKQLDVPKDLTKKTESGFTKEQATRVYLWNKMGEKIPGLSKADLKELNDVIENDAKLKVFADQILSITKGDGYSTPKENWAVGTITTDLIDVLNTKKRGKYLETWKQNKDLIYSKENLNKLEAAYGPKYRAALENSLRRMESGSNRISGGNRLSNQVLDYINNSTGAIMFFNARSAVLQTISAANFINWGFNNPYKAGKAFANQPQYWRDFTELMNSDYLKDRRNGLKLNINESEIANAAKTSGNKAKAALNYILEKGYLPTKFADSFAIASGGATFYRNRINDLIKNEGRTEAEAKEIAMKEFRQVSEMSQQSSDPSKISQQQSSDLGRIVLQFANTPMQYARIQKRAAQDIANGRGDLKTNISKIAYYGFLQNMLFNGLQQAVTSLGFGDEEMTDAEEKKLIKSANGMLDSSLRGLGMAGVTVQVLKNLGIDIYDRSKRDRPEFTDSYKKLLEFSPAIKSKLGKFQSAAYPFDSKKRRAEVFEKGFSLDNPAYESMAKVITGTTNLPLDRLYSKVNNLSAAMDEENEAWQSIAMFLGWPEWQIKGKQNYVEAPKTEEEKIKIKEQRSKIRVKEAKGSTDYETLKKLNKKEQVEMLLKLGYPKGKLRRSNFKEAELIEEIIKRNKK